MPVCFWAVGLACSLTLTVLLTAWLRDRYSRRESSLPMKVEPAKPVFNPWAVWVFPTPQTRLLEADAVDVFQPTVSGRPESALYGSTRTGTEGGRLVARFHEGVDIAPVSLNMRGVAQDPVCAVADGRIGYINRVAGRSDYGLYVVLLHDDPLGDVYTLYAHLAEVDGHLTEGAAVQAGTRLGIMGNTPATVIPTVRAHLHFEVGLIMHSRFDAIAADGARLPIHGVYNGRNLCGLDPLRFFRYLRDHPDATFLGFIREVPVVMEVVLGTSVIPEFFRRYPLLWEGGAPEQGAVRVYVSESGLPLRGHPETELRPPARGRAVIARVDEGVMGSNGVRLVVRNRSEWRLTAKGGQWVNLLVR